MHNDYTFQCFIDNIVKKIQKNFLAPISLFHFFLNCKINPKAVVNSRTFVVVCLFAMVVHQIQRVWNLKQSNTYQILPKRDRIPFSFAFALLNVAEVRLKHFSSHYFYMFRNRPAFMSAQIFKRRSSSHWCHTRNWWLSHIILPMIIMMKMTGMISP